jgi:hypothetical protein
MAVLRVGSGYRISVNLQHVVGQIEDPVVGNPGPRIETALLPPIECQARLGHFDDENRVRRMRAAMVTPAAWYHRDVRLRLGVLVERDGAMGPDRPSGAKDLT